MKMQARVIAAGACGLLAAAPTGCKPYRIEYHKRPAYMMTAAGLHENESVTLDDGTVIVYSTRKTAPDVPGETGPGGKRFQIREEREDGTVVLRALLPQQVLANTLTCLGNQEYDLIWEQLLSDRTRREYELRGEDAEAFKKFLEANRNELGATLTRMMLGLSSGDAFMKNIGGGVVRFYFHPRIAPQFKFKTVDVIGEGGGLKLLLIR